jgi:hypothetical protein
MLQRPTNVTRVTRLKNQRGGDATSLPYEFYNPLAGDYPSSAPVMTPVGGFFGPQIGGNHQVGHNGVKQIGGDATSMPNAYYNPIAAGSVCNGFFCGDPNNYLDFFYRGACARNNARTFMNDEPFNPQGETLTGWQAPNAIPPYTGNQRPTVQNIRARERSVVTPQGMVVKSGLNRGTCGSPATSFTQGRQVGGGTFGAPFANNTFGCGPVSSPNSGLSYRFNECDLQTGVNFVPL